jgi:iron(II)-dependent oxidoreductase
MSKGKRKPRRKAPAHGSASHKRSEGQGTSGGLELQAEVRLKPFLGLKPGTYLTILYAIILLFALFMLLFYKGLREQGTYVRIHSLPPRAAVQLDGNYAGSTPCDILVRKGSHTLEVSKPYYESQTLNARFAGPIFGTLFVRPVRAWSPRLPVADPSGLARNSLDEFAANPQIPEILSQTALATFQSGPEVAAALNDFLNHSKYFVTSALQLNEALRALGIIDSAGGALTPQSLLASVGKIAQYDARYQNFPLWLAVVLPEDMSKSFVQSTWFREFLNRYQEWYASLLQTARQARAGAPGAPLSLLGLTFRSIPAGTLVQGASEDQNLTVQVPHPVAVEAFYLSETEIPVELYRRFLAESPDWGPGGVDRLVANNWVTPAYLEGWKAGDSPPGDRNLPVVNVSYYAAQAFCSWFTRKLPPSLAGYEVRLPTESEWEWAARGGLVAQPYPLGASSAGAVFFTSGIQGPAPVGASAANGYGLKDMAGNVWEWCEDWYSPVKYLFSSWDPATNAEAANEPSSGVEKVVRGGSWSNERELVKVYTRGSQPPAWCTPYLGFRVLLARTRT